MGDAERERHAPTHRISDQMSVVQIQFVEDRCELANTRAHRVCGGVSGSCTASMTDQVDGERPMGIAQSACDARHRARRSRKAVEQDNGRSTPHFLDVEPNISRIDIV